MCTLCNGVAQLNGFCKQCEEEVNGMYINVNGMTDEEVQYILEDAQLASKIIIDLDLPF